MNTAEFEQALAADGFSVEHRTLEANATTTEHAHAFEVRALVTDGEITLGVDGVPTVYRAGDVFVMPAQRRHTEAVGPEGVRYIVGRRSAAA